MPLKLSQVVERVRAAQFAGVDQAHKQIPHLRAVARLVEQGVFAVQDRPLSAHVRTRCCPAAHRPRGGTTSAAPSVSTGTKSRCPTTSLARRTVARIVGQARREVLPSPGRSRPGGRAIVPAATDFALGRCRHSCKSRRALPTRAGTPRENVPPLPRTAAVRGPDSGPRSSPAPQANSAARHHTSESARPTIRHARSARPPDSRPRVDAR